MGALFFEKKLTIIHRNDLQMFLFGTIEVGKRADLLLVNNNPFEDIANIKNILGVMASGRWYEKVVLQKWID